VVSLLLFSESQPRQPTGPSEPCVSGCSFLPVFVITLHSTWLFTFAKHSCRDQCGIVVPFGQYTCSFYELFLASGVFILHIFGATLWEPDGRDVLLLRFNRGRAGLKAVRGLRWLSVAGVNWTQTEQKISGRLKTR
jgi:hypothetical protein